MASPSQPPPRSVSPLAAYSPGHADEYFASSPALSVIHMNGDGGGGGGFVTSTPTPTVSHSPRAQPPSARDAVRVATLSGDVAVLRQRELALQDSTEVACHARHSGLADCPRLLRRFPLLD